MKILVTGGTVFVSRYVASYFAGKGHTVSVLNRGSRPQPEGVRHICADRHDPGNILKQSCFDAVLDITAYTGEDVRLLADALGAVGCYILLSSSAVYPETLPQPFHEQQAVGKNRFWGDYGVNKIGAESALFDCFPQGYAIRPPYLYGPMNNIYREAFVFECAEQGLPFYIPGDGSLPLQFFHVGDLCRLIEAVLAQRPQQHIFNAGNPETVAAEDWVKICYHAAGKEPVFRRISEEIPQRSYFPFYPYAYRLDVSAQQALLPETVPLEQGLAESYRWWHGHRGDVIRKPFLDYIANNFQEG
ncbi:MAG: NAD-dependent epimerase/dehydratase family protein [Oscillospiraceae bacterium]|nr:NAD-dependent epimerase/dehydratase family protein [Oscillospiraceae bacterium]